jgi:hypothetical protein
MTVMAMTHSHQEAVPSFRDLLPTIGLLFGFFLLGFTGVVIGTKGYFAPYISQGVLWSGMVVCAISGGLILMSFKSWRLADELDRRGLIARGTITDLGKDNGNARGLPFRKHTNYYVVYVFDLTVPDVTSQQFVATQVVDQSLYTQLSVETKVRVRFLPENPNVSRIETRSWKWEYRPSITSREE